jgi:membrane protease YdiL (CAAX protease family)
MAGGLELVWNPDSLFLIVVILLTTPFQAAGEEYGVRGLLARSIGSWFSSSRVGLVVATVLTSVVFMLLHGAGDPWLNGYYFGMGVIFSLLVWRTGGLEAAVALHMVNNLVGEITVPFGDLGSMFDRHAGVAGPEILIQVFFTVAIAVAMWWLSGRSSLTRSAAPAAYRPEPGGNSGVLWNSSPHDR